MKKKWLAIGLAAVMGISVTACGSPAASETKDSAEAAQSQTAVDAASGEQNAETQEKPGYRDPATVTGTVVAYTPMDEGQMQIVEDVFYAHYPDCTIEWLSDSIGTLMTKIQSEASNPYADVVLGGLFQSDDDKYYPLLEKYTASNAADQTVVDPNGYYVYQDVQYMGLIVNEELEKKLGVKIEGYKDLLNPALKGYVILADPGSTSSGFRQFTTMLELMKGSEYADEDAWNYLKELMGNAVSNTSSSQVYKSVMDGEYAVGLSYESIILYQLASGAENIRLVYPKEGNTACANGSALVKGAPHREAAEALLELMGTEEMQLARAKGNCARGTNRNFSFEGFASDSEIGLKELDFAYIREHKDEFLDMWATAWEEFGNASK